MKARLALPLALGLALAAPSLGFGFLADDFTLLRYARATGFARFFRDDFSGRLIYQSDFYRPLVTSLLRVEALLFGLGPLGYHLVNVVLFLLGIALCVVLLGELGVSPAGQLVGGAIFAVIPSHVASVGWVSDVGDVLVGALVLLAAIAAAKAGAGPAAWSVVAVLATLLALLTKETGAVAVPLAVLAYAIGRARPGSPSPSPMARGPGGEAGGSARWRPLVPDGRAVAFGAELALGVGAYAALRFGSGVGDPLGAGRFARGFGDYLGNVRYMAQISIGALDGTRDGPLVPWRLVGVAAVVLLLLALKGARPSPALGLGLVWLVLGVGSNAFTAAPWLACVPSIGVALVAGASWTKPSRDTLKLAATAGLIALDLALSLAWSQRWARASAIARETVDALVSARADGLVLDVPFDYVEVPVFPNGLEDAVFLAGGRTVHPVVYYAGRSPTLRAAVRVLSPSRVELGVVPGDPGGAFVVGHDRYVGTQQQAEALGLRFTRVAGGPDGAPALEIDCDTRAWVLSDAGVLACGRGPAPP